MLVCKNVQVFESGVLFHPPDLCKKKGKSTSKNAFS